MKSFKEHLTEAVLTGSATDGRTNIQKYVIDNPKALDIEYELDKDAKFFDDEMNELTTLPAKTKIKLKSRQIRIVKRSKMLDTTFGWVAAGKVKKPTSFSVMTAEIEQTNELNMAIQKAIKDVDSPIDIKIGKFIIRGVVLADRDSIKGDPKADVVLKNVDGEEIGFISLKKAGGAKAFQQYSGISPRSNIFHKEIDEFINAVYNETKKGTYVPKGFAVFRKIKDQKLLNLAIYGPDFGGKFGRENCHCIGQGKPKLTHKKGILFELSFSDHMGINGDVKWAQSGSYMAVFGAVLKNGRQVYTKDKKVRNVRAGIMPISLLTNRRLLKEI